MFVCECVHACVLAFEDARKRACVLVCGFALKQTDVLNGPDVLLQLAGLRRQQPALFVIIAIPTPGDCMATVPWQLLQQL